MPADVMIFLLICLFLIKEWLNGKRIKQLENRLMDALKDEYIAFVKPLLQQPKVEVIKNLRQHYPELSLVNAVKIYELANKEHNHSQ